MSSIGRRLTLEQPKMAIKSPSEVDIDSATSMPHSDRTEARPPEALSDPSTTDVHASLPAGS